MSEATPRGRRWLRWLAIAVASLVAFLCLARGAFDLWRHAVVPADAPRIAMSLDDTWLNELGITRATYDQAMARAGAKLVSLEPDAAGEPPDPGRLGSLLDEVDGLLLTGGGDVDPELYGGDPQDASLVNRLRDDFEIGLIREARRRSLPILGICRGCQILNVAHGGTLRSLRSPPELRDAHFHIRGHDLRVEPGTLLERLLGGERLEGVTSFHGQAVARPGGAVRVAARSDDGVIEAIEIGGEAGSWIVGVQWHPEMTIQDDRQQGIFRAFVARAREARERRLRTRR
ncbi:MAG: gamma-glutamyl-gamma-aminobutyrate hydrolase family protein [Planctomycetota bacterium]|nr:gamma-glutamyl-gamma-aminobutyrate hydrolase family protein [Planctomycetota bacterium]